MIRLGPFIVSGEPVALGRPRFTRSGRVYTPKKSEAALEEVVQAIRNYEESRREPIATIDKPVHLIVDFIHARPKRMRKGGRVIKNTKPDIDNCLKLILDGISRAGLWTDDNLVAQITAKKYYGETGEKPYTVFYIFEAE